MEPLSKKSHLSKDLLTQTAFLAALCLFFSTLEYLFPRPVPFFRLGLANLPILLSINILPLPYLLLLALLKVIGQGLIHGTLASYVVLFSFSGTFLSLFAMFSAKRIPGISYIGLSIIGAMFSNVAQVTLSIFIVFGINARFIIPYFFTLGLISGTAMGVFANWFTSKSKWYEAFQKGIPFKPTEVKLEELKKTTRKKATDYIASIVNPQKRFILGLLLLIPLLFQEVLLLKIIHVFLLGILCKLSGKRLSYFYFINLIFWITLFQILSPFGQVLLDLRIITITIGSLESGLHKAFLLIGLVFTSLFSVTPGLRLPGRLGGVLAKMFYYYEELYNGKRRIRRATFIYDVDNLLGETQSAVVVNKDMLQPETRKPRDIIFYFLILAFFYGLLFLSRFI